VIKLIKEYYWIIRGSIFSFNTTFWICISFNFLNKFLWSPCWKSIILRLILRKKKNH